jgi:hypothetical protein
MLGLTGDRAKPALLKEVVWTGWLGEGGKGQGVFSMGVLLARKMHEMKWLLFSSIKASRIK